ncbi:MAG: hypothetical protein ACE5FD_16325 [Anaerolineae bacterium]
MPELLQIGRQVIQIDRRGVGSEAERADDQLLPGQLLQQLLDDDRRINFIKDPFS